MGSALLFSIKIMYQILFSSLLPLRISEEQCSFLSTRINRDLIPSEFLRSISENSFHLSDANFVILLSVKGSDIILRLDSCCDGPIVITGGANAPCTMLVERNGCGGGGVWPSCLP